MYMICHDISITSHEPLGTSCSAGPFIGAATFTLSDLVARCGRGPLTEWDGMGWDGTVGMCIKCVWEGFLCMDFLLGFGLGPLSSVFLCVLLPSFDPKKDKKFHGFLGDHLESVIRHLRSGRLMP